MRTCHFVGLVLLALCLDQARAQPEHELRDCVEQLIKAGSYAWEHRTQHGTIRVRAPVATGETEIGGFTRGNIGPRNVTMFDYEIAFFARGSWRHGRDLTPEDLADLRMAGRKVEAVNRVHPLPHELLSLLLPAAKDVEKQGGVLSAEVDPNVLDAFAILRYFASTQLPRATSRSHLNLPIPGRTSRLPQLSRPGPTVTFFVWIDQKLPVRVTVEIDLTGSAARRDDPAVADTLKTTHEFKLLEVGVARPVVPAEARALFLDAAAGKRGR
jgi:hypothetical protein